MLSCSRVTIRSVKRHTSRHRGPTRSDVGCLMSPSSIHPHQPTRPAPPCRRYFTSANRTCLHTADLQRQEEDNRSSRNYIMYSSPPIVAMLPTTSTNSRTRRFASSITTPSSIESNGVRREESPLSTRVNTNNTSSSNAEKDTTAPPPAPPTNTNSEAVSSSMTDSNVHNDHSASPPSSSSLRANLRARYRAKRHEYQCRAVDYRDTARTHYQEFKEHPGQTAREGAVSVKGMIQRYGPVFVGTYATVYFTTLALLFGGVESGVLDPVVLFQWLGQSGGDGTAESTVHLVVEFMEQHEWTKPYAPVMERNPSVANLAVAWIAVKFTEPIRLALSVAITPRLARYFGYSQKST